MRVEIREKPWDLVLVIVIASLLLGVVLVTHTGSLRIVLGLVFVLFLPGYIIVSALFPKAENLDAVERTALSFGLSIALVPLVGLLLNYTPWGIRLEPILTSLYFLIISGSVIAWYRRSQISLEDRFGIAISIELPKGEDVTTIDKILTIVLAISIVIALGTLIYVITAPREGERFTEFYVLDENGTIENYPNNLKIGENGTVIVGVICREQETSRYTIEIELLNSTGERENKTLGQYNLILDHNQFNEIVFNFDVSDNGTYKLQFLLYINDKIEPYRELHLWVNAKP